MAYYECVFIARGDASPPQVEALADQMTAIVVEGGGQVTKRENWGLRNLAYRVKKNRKGHYILLNIDAPAPAVHEMERQMRISEDILRYLTIRVDELEEGPSAVMSNRGGDRERGERGGRFGGKPDRDGGGRFGGRDREGGPRRHEGGEGRGPYRADARSEGGA
ncbi:MAG: 30S ribosomal protein S6 [Alphaproteobacteria bacterium]|nr:30S ribosomal protein S6 [Alphaproteobacteria bacterium]